MFLTNFNESLATQMHFPPISSDFLSNYNLDHKIGKNLAVFSLKMNRCHVGKKSLLVITFSWGLPSYSLKINKDTNRINKGVEY